MSSSALLLGNDEGFCSKKAKVKCTSRCEWSVIYTPSLSCPRQTEYDKTTHQMR